jgi:two-component system nitrogen regulation sensor histidine kinase NtrY
VSGRTRGVSLARKLALLVAANVLLTAALCGIAARLTSRPLLIAGVGALVGLLLAWITVAHFLGGTARTLQAISDGVRSFRDTDFSMRLAVTRHDELGELVALYNEMGDALRSERHDLYQRELLLDTVVQGAPIAIVLTSSRERVVLANRAARDLLSEGRRLEGQAMPEVLARCSPEMREALLTPGDVLFTVGRDPEEETYRSVRRSFHLNTQRHTLHIVERLTPELRRREVEVWKKAIRVMSHEMNNSLAPIRSLVNSARTIVGRPEHAHRLDGIFDTIEERATHLAAFLAGYAAFARLPGPTREEVPWEPFLEGVRRMFPFRLEGPPPAAPGWFDPSQMEQVLINLVKNAREAGSADDAIVVSVLATADRGIALLVSDRGPGMDEETMKRALVPFWSSKPSGSGLGLPLCSEILEAHGGRLRLQSRPGGGTTVTCWLPPR